MIALLQKRSALTSFEFFLQFVPIGDVLENRFAMLEGGVLGVDDELEKMKKSIGAPSKRAELSDKMNEYGYININVR